MFRTRVTAIAVAVLLLVASCISERNSRPEALDRQFAARAVADFEKHGYLGLAEYMCYPETETLRQRGADQQGVGDILTLVERRFGRVVVRGPVGGVPNSVLVS